MIHKEGTDPVDTRNYHPISLLNTDFKIYTNILANRFKEFLREWIGEDQCGFLPNRNIKDNIRIVVDILEYYETHHQKEIALLALDAEKAFDNLNWDFFKLLFKELDIGFQFQNTINAIYEQQLAKILINGHLTKTFSINKGVQ